MNPVDILFNTIMCCAVIHYIISCTVLVRYSSGLHPSAEASGPSAHWAALRVQRYLSDLYGLVCFMRVSSCQGSSYICPIQFATFEETLH